jgi:hypothetical protein
MKSSSALHAAQPGRSDQPDSGDTTLDALVHERVRVQEDELIAEHLRLAAWLLLGALPIYAIVDHYLGQPRVVALHSLKLLMTSIALGVLTALGWPRYRQRCRALGFLLIVSVSFISAGSSALTGDTVSHPLFLLLLALITGAFVPWGAVEQAGVVAVVAAATGLSAILNAGMLPAVVGYPLIVGGLTCLSSIYLAHVMHRGRVSLAREYVERQRAQLIVAAEAQTAAALARAGTELLEAGGAADLLQRVCRVTAEVLECDCSYALVRDPSGKSYSVRGYYGFRPEDAEAIGLIEAPAGALDQVTKQFGEVAVHRRRGGTNSMHPVAQFPIQFDIGSRMYALLRSGEEIHGFLAAGWSFHRNRPTSCGDWVYWRRWRCAPRASSSSWNKQITSSRSSSPACRTSCGRR